MISRVLLASAFRVGARCGVAGEPDHGDAPEGVIRLAVAALVESVTDRLARRRLDRGRAAERGECGVAGEPVRVVAGCNQQDGGDVGADTDGFAQGRVRSGGEHVELAPELVKVDGEGLMLASQGSHRHLGALVRVSEIARPEPCSTFHARRCVEGLEVPSELIGSAHDEIAQLVGDPGAGVAGRAERHSDRSDGLDDPVCGLRHRRGVTVQRRSGGGLGIDGVVLAVPAASLAVRAVHLEHLDALGA
jgi:hypothetical protein